LGRGKEAVCRDHRNMPEYEGTPFLNGGLSNSFRLE
jgi:hypothetical protein